MPVPVHAAQRSRDIEKGTCSKLFFLNSFVNPYSVDPEVRCARDTLSTPQLYPLGASRFLLIYFMLSIVQNVVMPRDDDSP